MDMRDRFLDRLGHVEAVVFFRFATSWFARGRGGTFIRGSTFYVGRGVQDRGVELAAFQQCHDHVLAQGYTVALCS